MSAKSSVVRLAILSLTLTSCTWFTDFKQQPKVDPWESEGPGIPPRGNPQGSVPIYGTLAPEFAYARTSLALEQMSSIQNPVPADSASVSRGRKYYQINCAVCHGPLGMGNGTVVKYGVFPPAIGVNSNAAVKLTDGYIFGIIRNGRNLMPSYNRIEEPDRWDVVNYVRSLQGKLAIAADSTHGLPGETGDKLPGATQMGPTRPAPYYHMIGAQAGAREGLAGPAAVSPAKDSVKTPAAGTKQGAKRPEDES